MAMYKQSVGKVAGYHTGIVLLHKILLITKHGKDFISMVR